MRPDMISDAKRVSKLARRTLALISRVDDGIEAMTQGSLRSSFVRDIDEAVDKVGKELEKVGKIYALSGERVWVTVYVMEAGGYAVGASDVSPNQARASPKGFILNDGSAIYLPSKTLFRLASRLRESALKGRLDGLLHMEGPELLFTFARKELQGVADRAVDKGSIQD